MFVPSPIQMTIAQQAEEIMTEMMECPDMIENIKNGMTPKEAARTKMEASFSLYGKLDRNTEKGRQLDDVVMKTMFNTIRLQLA